MILITVLQTNGRGLNCAAVKVTGPSVQDRNWERQFTVVTTAVVAGYITGTAPIVVYCSLVITQTTVYQLKSLIFL